MTKSKSQTLARCLRRMSPVAVAALAACASSSPPVPAPAPAAAPAPGASAASAPSQSAASTRPIGEVERATFAASLDVHLDSMTRRASGLYVQDLKYGQGPVAARTRTVVVRYAGWLTSGKQFDSGEITVTLGSNKTIPAWEEGLLGMRVGGQRRLVVPPNLAYGARGAGDDIPPNAVLVFVMEIMSVF